MDDSISRVDVPAGQTHYDVLGINPDANPNRVHRAFVAVLAEFRANPTPAMEERVRRARIAYKVLSDPQSRVLYNRDLNLSPPPVRKWEKHYLQAEEESLEFWTGAATLSIVAFLGFFWQYLVIKGLLWLPRAFFHAIDALLVRKRPADEPPEQPVDSQGG